MATAKSVSVQVGSKKVDPYHVTVQQRSDWHHRFEIALSSDKIEDAATSVAIDKSIEHVGKTAEINIKCTDKSLTFKGIITTIRIDRTYTGDNLVIFGGYSPTYLLEDGAGTRSFAEKDIKGIVDEVFGVYPSNLLNAKIDTQYSGKIPYIVQYKETNYQFLSRIAAVYGEWFYFDGQGIVFGKLPSPESLELTLGKDLESFDYGVQLRPSKFKYQFYNYAENRMVEEASTGFKPGWLDNYGKKALDAADSLFPSEPINPTWQDTPDDSLIKHLTETRKSSILSDTTFFKGHGSNSGLTIGSRVQVKANNKVGKEIVPAFIGNFRITAVTHHLNANKDYSNDFEAIPVTVTAPPVNKNVFKPEAEPQVAVVKENHDPDGLGRVRVQFKWQSGDEMTPWIRVVTSSAAGGRGMYFVPEKDDEVQIDFQQGNPDRPYVSGALFHGNAKPTWGQSENNVKALTTRGGHSILLSDESGKESITISDKDGNTITLDTSKKQITISAPEKLVLTSKQISIEASEKVTIDGTQNVEVTSMDVKVDGSTKVEVTSTAEVDVNSGVTTKVSGLMTEVSGTTQLDLKSDLLLNASGMITNIEGQTMTNVKGNVALNLNC